MYEFNALIRSGWKDEGVAFHADSAGRDVYRLYNTVTKQHHYTVDARERDFLVSTHRWNDEGVAWHVGASSNVPVYRLYNTANGEHLWTTDAREYQALGGTASDPANRAKAADVLAGLKTNDTLAPGYVRAAFGDGWVDVDGNGCGTRDDILSRDLTNPTKLDNCRIGSGVLHDPYTGSTIPFTRGSDDDNDGGVQIDHVVALSNAWKTGANAWSSEQRIKYANDPYVLLAVDDQANQDKRDYAADKWLPANAGYRCDYVARQIGIKAKYSLNVTNAERTAMSQVLASCPAQTVPAESDTAIPPVSKPSPSPAPSPNPTPTPSPAPNPAPSPKPNVQNGITPGAFCSPEGAKGIGKKNGVTYTCKRDDVGRLRWRR
ncbi:deoxyribonuclease [Bifidobacterium callitrichos]|nr:deoxyribonuclease [Bifidobacterium callitrichos]